MVTHIKVKMLLPGNCEVGRTLPDIKMCYKDTLIKSYMTDTGFIFPTLQGMK